MDALTATYFVSFVAGAGFAIVSWVLGALEGHGDVGGHDGADGLHGDVDADVDLELGGRVGVGQLHAGGGAHGLVPLGPHGQALAHGAHQHGVPRAHGHGHHSLAGKLVSPLLNLSAIAALACIGGGAGFVARRAGAGVGASLLAAIPSGLVAAYLVGGLVAWLRRGTKYKRATQLGGSLATVLAPVSTERLGEIMYVIDGARATLPARGTKDLVLEPGTEVVILDVKDGVARVGAVAELLGIEPPAATAATPRPKLPQGNQEGSK